jgi:antitoxin (DNA-binding transcriptional repressor) of toxin-antitoxin stability system
MRTLEVAQATAPLAEYARDVQNQPLILTIDGRPVAALVPIENTGVETVTLSIRPPSLALIERLRGRQKTEGSLSSAELRHRLGH